jgi:hypothetical protein
MFVGHSFKELFAQDNFAVQQLGRLGVILVNLVLIISTVSLVT